MFISTLFIIILSTGFIMQSQAHISIQMGPEDIDGVGEFFESLMWNRQEQYPIRSMRCVLLKKVFFGCIQMGGIMLTLVSANLLTVQLSPTTTETVAVQHQQHIEMFDKNLTAITIHHKFETCDMDEYGCNRNLCWKTCTVKVIGDNNYTSWCFSKPKQNKHKFHFCKDALECSPCWECSGPCMGQVCSLFLFLLFW